MLIGPSRLLTIVCLFSLPTPSLCQESEHPQSVEARFRQTAQAWQSSGTYALWLSFAQALMLQFESSLLPPLEIVGGLEEGILAIERATQHEGENPPRDHALAELYYAYGKLLTLLDEQQCTDLALDPHTLLIGAETVQQSQPSTALCVQNAENSLRNAVTLNANHARAEELLQTLIGDNVVHQRQPKEFVESLFDSFADHFDETLSNLQYQVPRLVGELSSKLETSYKNALDAGCGTGLAGRYLRPLVRSKLVGVDASEKMLRLAQACTRQFGCGLDVSPTPNFDDPPLYDALLNMDLEGMTRQTTLESGFDLIVAADVLVYFGSLENLLQVFASISNDQAKLVFSCERTTVSDAPLGFRLQSSGRFAHSKEHAIQAAQTAGYQLLSYQEIVPRMEKGEPVKGHLFGFELQTNNENSKHSKTVNEL